ncbi:hypothetical protein BHE90_003975 [Fusarium euwallaceae]|uniref:Uncharacterized protein n=1 Tax=Fusarium euwallaceae TaxID=1147111 RepID=A0A430M0N5_9HYPO|nr:hypothetical protein BHE90_003975 [Fusarium euwallaceae]
MADREALWIARQFGSHSCWKPAPALPSVSDEFCLGPIPVLDEDPDGHDGSQPKQRPSPILDKDDVKYITDMGIETRQKYELVLGQTTWTVVNGVEQLRLKVESQKGRIDVKTDIKKGFRQIRDKLQEAVHELRHIPTKSQSRKPEGRIKGSKSSKISKGSKVSKRSKSPRSFGAFKILEVFENLKQLFGQTERDVAPIASHVYLRHVLGSKKPFATAASLLG